MSKKGVCQIHKVEFILTEGCPLCLAEKRGGADCHISDFTSEPVTEEQAAEMDQNILDDAAREAKEQATLVPKPGGDTEVANYYSQALKLREYAESRVIKSVEDIKVATDDLTIISRLKRAMEAKKKDFLRPFQESIKAINDNYKFWMGPVEIADTITRDKILAFNREQDRFRREQEEVNRLRMEAAQKEAALKGGEITESVDLVEVAPEVKRVSTEMGTAGMVDCWKYEVVDLTLVPNEYKIIDTAMLNAIAKKHHDTKQIPGVRFYNEPILRVNTK